MNNSITENELTQMITDAMASCLEERGFIAPLILAAIGTNGSILVIRMPGAGGEPQILAEHYVDDMFRAPLNLMITDQNGQAARVVISVDRKTTFH